MGLTSVLKLLCFSLLSLAPAVSGLTCFNDDKSHFPDIVNSPATSDVNAIINSLQQNITTTIGGFALDPSSIHVPKTQSVIIDYGSARVCLANANLLFSTFVGTDQVIQALDGFLSACCTDDTGPCQGGSTEVDGLPTNIDHSGVVFVFVQSSHDGIEHGCLQTADDDPNTLVTTWAVGGVAGAVTATSVGIAALGPAELFALRYGGRIALSAIQALISKFSVGAQALAVPLEVAITSTVDILSDATPDELAAAAETRLKAIIQLLEDDGVLAAEEATSVGVALSAEAAGAAIVAGIDDFGYRK